MTWLTPVLRGALVGVVVEGGEVIRRLTVVLARGVRGGRKSRRGKWKPLRLGMKHAGGRDRRPRLGDRDALRRFARQALVVAKDRVCIRKIRSVGPPRARAPGGRRPGIVRGERRALVAAVALEQTR